MEHDPVGARKMVCWMKSDVEGLSFFSSTAASPFPPEGKVYMCSDAQIIEGFKRECG